MTLADTLVASNGIISQRQAGKVCSAASLAWRCHILLYITLPSFLGAHVYVAVTLTAGRMNS